MRKYYVIEISVMKEDPTKDTKSIYTYDNVNTAIGTFHSKLGSAMKSDAFLSELVMVIDDNGAVIKSEKYEVPQPEPTPEPEEPVEEITE